LLFISPSPSAPYPGSPPIPLIQIKNPADIVHGQRIQIQKRERAPARLQQGMKFSGNSIQLIARREFKRPLPQRVKKQMLVRFKSPDADAALLPQPPP